MEQVWISLGSNLGDRLGHLRQALAALGKLGKPRQFPMRVRPSLLAKSSSLGS